MKNIKNSIFLTMVVVTYMSGMDEFSPAAQTMKAFSYLQDGIIAFDRHRNEQQRVMQAHELSQQRIMQNHEQALKIATDNHELNQQQALDRLQMAKQNHETKQNEAQLHQKINNDNHADHQFTVKNNQLRALEKEAIDRNYQEKMKVISHYKMQAQIDLAKAELTFSKCLVTHKNSSEIATSGIPSACEDHALTIALLGDVSKVDTMIASFKKIINREPAKQ